MPFICEKCGFTCDSQSKLNIHLNKKIPCISNKLHEGGIICDFCNNNFASNSNLKRHYDNCVVRKNPTLLIKRIEEQKEIIEQKDVIIKQKDELIEQMKDVKPDINIEGNENNIDQSIHNIKNVDNSINIKLHVHLDNAPMGFRTLDMEILMSKMFDTPGEYFLNLRRAIMDYAKEGKMEKSIENLMMLLHDSNSFKDGQNLRYCKDGKYKGKLLIYDYDDNDKGSWYVADIEPVSKIISNEFKKFNEIHRGLNNKGGKDVIEPVNKKEKKNLDAYTINSERLEFNIEHRDTIFKIVKRFKISSDSVPSEISDDIVMELGKNDQKPSCKAKIEMKAMENRELEESRKPVKHKKQHKVDKMDPVERAKGRISDYEESGSSSEESDSSRESLSKIVVVKESPESSSDSSGSRSSKKKSKKKSEN